MDISTALQTAIQYHRQGQLPKAEAIYRKILSVQPDHADALHLLGLVAHGVNQNREAVRLIRKAIDANPQNGAYHNNLGNVHMALSRLDDAEESFATAARIQPDMVEAHINLGNLFKYRGKTTRAKDSYGEALKIDPDSVGAYYNLAQLTTFQEKDDAFFALESIRERMSLNDKQSTELHFALGKMYADIGAYESAFRNYQAGNGYRKKITANRFDPDSFEKQITLFVDTFDAGFFDRRKDTGNDTQLPVFIVGMPRSGTSLVEQILSSHRRVFGAGELPVINQMVEAFLREHTGLSFDRIVERLDQGRVNRLAGQYVDILEKRSGGAVRVTDKMPGNFLNLWFITLLFPRAKIIHCRRHPLDTCLSCYFTHFKQPLPYKNDLSTLGRYYRQYERLMKHWRSALPVPLLEIQYETLVENQEIVTRQMLEFCGLEWDDRCLAFYENDRPVATASGIQVRQKMHTRAVGRWKNYRRFLGPLIESLGIHEEIATE